MANLITVRDKRLVFSKSDIIVTADDAAATLDFLIEDEFDDVTGYRLHYNYFTYYSGLKRGSIELTKDNKKDENGELTNPELYHATLDENFTAYATGVTIALGYYDTPNNCLFQSYPAIIQVSQSTDYFGDGETFDSDNIVTLEGKNLKYNTADLSIIEGDEYAQAITVELPLYLDGYNILMNIGMLPSENLSAANEPQATIKTLNATGIYLAYRGTEATEAEGYIKGVVSGYNNTTKKFYCRFVVSEAMAAVQRELLINLVILNTAKEKKFKWQSALSWIRVQPLLFIRNRDNQEPIQLIGKQWGLDFNETDIEMGINEYPNLEYKMPTDQESSSLYTKNITFGSKIEDTLVLGDINSTVLSVEVPLYFEGCDMYSLVSGGGAYLTYLFNYGTKQADGSITVTPIAGTISGTIGEINYNEQNIIINYTLPEGLAQEYENEITIKDNYLENNKVLAKESDTSERIVVLYLHFKKTDSTSSKTTFQWYAEPARLIVKPNAFVQPQTFTQKKYYHFYGGTATELTDY